MPSSAALTNSCRKHSIPLCVAAVMLSSLSAGIAHSVAVAPKPPLHPAGQSGVLQILVMGDSYSAGNGAGGQINPDNGCYRSDLNYAGQFAAIIEAATGRKPQKVDNFACSGAKTSDFTHKQGTRLNFALSSPQPPQLSGLKNKHYDVIFLTLGGNDLKFDATAEFCLVTLTKIANQCERSLKNAERLITNGTLKKNIKNVLDAIHKQANSDAKIVLVGYPQLEGDPTYELAVGKSILPRKKAPPIQVGNRLNAGGTTVDGIQSDVVDELNAAYPANPPQFSFVSVKALFAGHELFANVFNPNRWMIEPLIDANVVNTYYHPNPMGWLQEAQLLACDTRVPNQKLAGTSTHNPVALPFNCPTSPPPPPPPTVTCADGGVHNLPFTCPPLGFPTTDHEGSIIFYVNLGASFIFPNWVSCSSAYCIVGAGNDVHLFRLSDLRDLGTLPLSTLDPSAAFISFGVPADQVASFMTPGPP